MTLPPIDSAVVSVILSRPEREFYNALLEKSQSVFERYVKEGTAAKSWFAIFSLLQRYYHNILVGEIILSPELSNPIFLVVMNRLRQACDHVSLTVKNRFDDSEIEAGDATATSDGAVSDKVNICILEFNFHACIHELKLINATLVSHGSIEQIQNYRSRCPM